MRLRADRAGRQGSLLRVTRTGRCMGGVSGPVSQFRHAPLSHGV